jgi:subtilisin family serine protease
MSDIELIKPAYKYQKQEMYYTNEILVEPLEGININEVIRKNGLENNVKVKEGKFYSIIEISTEYDACDIANKIQESGLVKYSHPNFMMPVEKHQVIPNDTYFNNQYYLRNTGQVFNPVENHFGLANADINASFAWNTTLGNNSVIVAVIDAGVTPNHPDLPNARQVRLNGSNFVPGENANDPTPGLHYNHGNATSGIIAATQNNNEGVTGIAPNVRIMPIKILGGDGVNPGINADNNSVASAIDFAWQNGAHVISNSWGYESDNPNFVPAIVAAINRAVTQGRGNLGCVVTFSASNTATHTTGGNGIVSFPSNVQINGVLTVGASDRDDEQADYSPTSNAASPNNQIIDLVAPSHRA